MLGNLGASDTVPGSIGTTGYATISSLAIPFKTGSSAADLTNVEIGLQAVSTGQNVTATLYADNGGEPASTPLGWTESLFVTNAFPLVYRFTQPPVQLAALTNYWMIVSPQVEATWIEANPSATPTAQNGSDWTYPAGGALEAVEGVWVSVGQQNAFSVIATAVPEPSTFVLAAVAGLGGLAALRRRTQSTSAA